MRVLLVCAAPYAGDPAEVARLGVHHDLIVAVDGGGELCLRAGLVPHLAIGDFDSLPARDLKSLAASGVEVLRFPARKDASDLELALQVVTDRGAESVTITAAFSGRLDHSLAAVGVLSRASDAVVIDLEEPGLRGWLLTADGRAGVSLAGDGATVSALALSGPARVAVSGARWSGGGIELRAFDSRGLSNLIDRSPMRVTVTHGAVLMLSPVDEEGRIAVAVG
jgi:thiamine pyrophosphokinase